MGWTHWEKLADKDSWYPENLNYDGSACYELGIRGKWKQSVTVTYVGETSNLKTRMVQYGKYGSHKWRELNKYWKYNYTLYFRYYPTKNAESAKSLEDDRLEKFGLERYLWNTNLGKNGKY